VTEFNYKYISSPLGEMEVKFDSNHIYSFEFIKEGENKKTETETPLTKLAAKQLQLYFAGELKEFDLPLQFTGTNFQKRVWAELAKIGFGKTISYLQMAIRLGDKKCIRAAASANSKNPFAIIIPCHRVIGTDGSLTGYAGGLTRKQWLLEHEARISGTWQQLF
jgi:methylated-DNA-[protein]-cysteine S-methyltransferase